MSDIEIYRQLRAENVLCQTPECFYGCTKWCSSVCRYTSDDASTTTATKPAMFPKAGCNDAQTAAIAATHTTARNVLLLKFSISGRRAFVWPSKRKNVATTQSVGTQPPVSRANQITRVKPDSTPTT